MKYLYIIRHAKSCWKNPLIADYDRPLNNRGEVDAKIIWNKIMEKGISPDVIFSSSANRAKKTCETICDNIWYDFNRVLFDKNIYDYHLKWVNFYLWYIMNIKNSYKNVFIIGHNDAWNELAEYLIWNDIWNIPTTWVVCISFDIDSRKDISYANWKMDFIIYPKMYK